MEKIRSYSFNHAWPFRLFGLLLVILAVLLYYFAGNDFKSSYLRVGLIVVLCVGGCLLLFKHTTKILTQKQVVLWQIGTLFLWFNYRNIAFDSVKSFVLRLRQGKMNMSNEHSIVSNSKPLWEVILRLRDTEKNDNKQGYIITTFPEDKKEEGDVLIRQLTSIVDQVRRQS